MNNSKHYDVLLEQSSYLRKLEEVLNPQLLQTCKRVAFNQNLFVEKDRYLDRIIEFTSLEELMMGNKELD